MNNKQLTARYSLVNAFFFMLICGTGGYANNFLQSKGFDSSVIGIILTTISILVLCGQTGMAPIIDRSAKLDEKKFVLGTLSFACVMYLLMLVIPAGSWLVLVPVVAGFSATSMGLPYLNNIAMTYKERAGVEINYGVTRGIGSLAYALGGQVIGRLLSWKTASILPVYLIVIGLCTVASVFFLPFYKKTAAVKNSKTETAEPISYGEFFSKYKSVIPVLVGLVAIYFAHMMINNYMINILEAIGGTTEQQGNAITLQAMVELPPMFLLSFILTKVSVNKLMAFAGIMYAVKHILIFIAPNMTVFYIACVLQMFSYALIAPITVYYAKEHIGAEDSNKGQAIFGATATIGGLTASFIGGFLLKSVGVHTTLLIGTISTVVGAVLLVMSTMKKDA